MTTQHEGRHANDGQQHELVTMLDTAHTEALDALDDERTLDAVAWMSAHLAATRRALHKTAHKSGAVNGKLMEQHDADERLESVLRMAERHVSGDALAANLDTERLMDALRDAIADHARYECSWVSDLLDASDDKTRADLQSSYEEALTHAPTRPHPHAPHDGVLGAAAFRLDAMRDKVLDTMDGRHVPTPRRGRKRVTPGRWGHYFLGGMQADQRGIKGD